MASHAALPAGTVIKQRYEIVKEIGSGAMGIVYLARDTTDNSEKAVKEQSCASLTQKEKKQFETLFRREASILKALKHPNLPVVDDFFEENLHLYLIMEFIEGKSLLKILEDSGCALSEQKVLEWAITICEVLRYLHNQYPPIIFRDIKPANIVMKPDGILKIVDFGIARFYQPGKNCDTISLGSPGYAALEQYQGKGQSEPRTDIYGLGVTMHVLLTDRDPSLTPFVFPEVTTLNHSVTYKTSRIIAQATMLDPAFRFYSAADMLYSLRAALRALLSGKAQTPATHPAVKSLPATPSIAAASSKSAGAANLPGIQFPGQSLQSRMNFAMNNPLQVLSFRWTNVLKFIACFTLTFILALPTAAASMTYRTCGAEIYLYVFFFSLLHNTQGISE